MPAQTTQRPASENYQSLLQAPRSKKSRTCLWISVVLFAFLLIAVPLGVLLWKIYEGDISHLKQSPINIITSKAVFDENLGNGNFVFNYDHEIDDKFLNSGHGWKIEMNANSNDTLKAVHLPGTYKLAQIHAHWDAVGRENGSEHTVNGIGFAGEIHLVHYNVKYKTLGDALAYSDGLAVLGIFLSEVDSGEGNSNLDPIVSQLKHIIYKNQSTILKAFHINKLLPGNLSQFWTYEGSLTTEPFSECVIWTVFRQSIPISSRQLNQFRRLKTYVNGTKTHMADYDDQDHHKTDDKKHDIHGYVRYPQPLNGRVVRASFKWGGKSK